METTGERVFNEFIMAKFYKRENPDWGDLQTSREAYALIIKLHVPPLTPNRVTLQRTKMYKSI